jgi:hypothetical protein
MRTNASSFPAVCSATVLAAIIATAAIGASGPAFAACGVSSGVKAAVVHPASNGMAGVNTGNSGSTGGTPASACPSRTNTTITANASALRAGLPGAHIVTHNNLTATHPNPQTTAHLQTPTGTTNKTAKKPKT